MPLLNLPLDIEGEKVTNLIEETVLEMCEEFKDLISAVYSDGVFPGTKQLSAPQRLANYLEQTEVADFPKLFDEDYLLRLGNGLEAPPVSKYWLNQLSIRESYERNRKDFLRLVTNADRPTFRRGMQ